jgi:hypothetical protein
MLAIGDWAVSMTYLSVVALWAPQQVLVFDNWIHLPPSNIRKEKKYQMLFNLQPFANLFI